MPAAFLEGIDPATAYRLGGIVESMKARSPAYQIAVLTTMMNAVSISTLIAAAVECEETGDVKTRDMVLAYAHLRVRDLHLQFEEGCWAQVEQVVGS